MTIFVDDLFTMTPRSERARRFGNRWCHMITNDSDLGELHAMALKIGLNRAMFQPHPTLPHYDLIPAKRALAIKYGAIPISAQELATRNFEAHKPRPGEQEPPPAQELAQESAPVKVEYRAGKRLRCQCTYGSKRPCQNLTNWYLMPRNLAICRTCALFLAQNKQGEHNAQVLAPMLATSKVDSWIALNQE